MIYFKNFYVSFCGFFSDCAYDTQAVFADSVKESIELSPLGGLCGGLVREELIDRHIQAGSEAIKNLQDSGVSVHCFLPGPYIREKAVSAPQVLSWLMFHHT